MNSLMDFQFFEIQFFGASSFKPRFKAHGFDACLMVHGSWLKAHGSWPREAMGEAHGSWPGAGPALGTQRRASGRSGPGPGDPEARPGEYHSSGTKFRYHSSGTKFRNQVQVP